MPPVSLVEICELSYLGIRLTPAPEVFEWLHAELLADTGSIHNEDHAHLIDADNPSGEELFERKNFTYEAEHDRYQCPAGKWLTLKQRNKGDRIYQADIGDCAACPLKSRCSGAQRRYVSRHAYEEAFERMEQRMLTNPQMMASRRSIVEHPFGNMKQWVFGNARFLLRQLEGARAEMALAVNAYNLKRAISVLGARQLMAVMG